MIEPISFEEITAHVERVKKAAREGMERDMRFRRLVDSAVHFAMTEHGQIDETRPEEAAHDIARHAAALLLARVYDEDGEIAMLKRERDHAMKLAKDSLMIAPPRAIFRDSGSRS